MKKRLTALLITAATIVSALPFTVASADGEEAYEKVYFENFDGENAIDVTTSKVKSYSNAETDEKATDGKAVKVVTGIPASSSGYSFKVNTDGEFDLSDGPIETYARIRISNVTSNIILNNIYNINGYYMDVENKKAANYCGLYGGSSNAKLMMWYLKAQNAFPTSLLTGGEYVTIKFTVNMDGSYRLSYSADDENYTEGPALSAEKLSGEKLPTVINQLVFNVDSGKDSGSGTAMEYYIDYVKVKQSLINKVASTSQADKSENVLLDTKPVVTFKYPVAEADLTKDNFKVEKNGSAVSEDDYSLSLDENDSKNVIIDFAASLEEGAEYKVTVNNVSADGTENTAMAKAYSYSFKAIKYFEIAAPAFSKSGENEVSVASKITANDVKVGDTYVVIAQTMKKDENGKMYIYDNSVLCGSFEKVNNKINFSAQLKYTEGAYVKLMLWTGFNNGRSYLNGTEAEIPSL